MNTNKEVNKQEERDLQYWKDRWSYICQHNPGRTGNHIEDLIREFLASQSSIDTGVEADLWKDIINYFNGTYADLTEREMNDAINFLKTKYRISPIAGAKWASSGEAVEQTVSMEEYNDAINEIGQLQEHLKEAEEEIRELSKFDER